MFKFIYLLDSGAWSVSSGLRFRSREIEFDSVDGFTVSLTFLDIGCLDFLPLTFVPVLDSGLDWEFRSSRTFGVSLRTSGSGLILLLEPVWTGFGGSLVSLETVTRRNFRGSMTSLGGSDLITVLRCSSSFSIFGFGIYKESLTGSMKSALNTSWNLRWKTYGIRL